MGDRAEEGQSELHIINISNHVHTNPVIHTYIYSIFGSDTLATFCHTSVISSEMYYTSLYKYNI